VGDAVSANEKHGHVSEAASTAAEPASRAGMIQDAIVDIP